MQIRIKRDKERDSGKLKERAREKGEFGWQKRQT